MFGSRPYVVGNRRRMWRVTLAPFRKSKFRAPSSAYGTEIEHHVIRWVRRKYPGTNFVLPTSDRAPFDFRFQPANPGPLLYAEVKSHRQSRGGIAETWWSTEEYTHAKQHGRIIFICVPAESIGGRVRDIKWHLYMLAHTDLPEWDQMYTI